MDAYLFYASTGLVIMASLSLFLSFLLHVRARRLDVSSKGLKADSFRKTFFVFDPNESRTILHRFLLLLPFLPIVCGLALAVLLFVVIDEGLLLTLVMFVMALSLMVVEESPEAYTQSGILIDAARRKSQLGVGDIAVLGITKRLLSQLTVYYLAVSVFLFVLSAILPEVFSSTLWYFARFFGYLLQLSATGGLVTWLLAMSLYALLVILVVFLAGRVKSRLFAHETPAAG